MAHAVNTLYLLLILSVEDEEAASAGGAIVGDDRIVTGPSETLVAARNNRVARTKPFDAEGTQLIDTAGWGDVI